jgi:cell division protein FtsI (penicillin-binding protein 3)
VAGRIRPYANWKPIEQATMSYGYGLSASLFQIARAYTIFARDGQLIPVSLYKVGATVNGPQVIRPSTAKAIREMLEMAAGPGGTAPKAQTMGYRVGGKTGTAHKQEGRGYAGKKYRSFFAGIAPISSPRVIVAVVIDEPSNGAHYGGEVAAPIFSSVVGGTLRSLNVAPDSHVKQLVITDAVPESVQ